MKLYYTLIRNGLRVQSPRKGEYTTEPTGQEPLYAGNPEWWYDPLMGLPKDQQWEYVKHFLKMGVYLYNLKGAALSRFVERRMAMVTLGMLGKLVGGVALLYGLAYMVLWIFNPSVTDNVEEEEYGYGWVMRYESKLWHARFVAWEPGGLPVFERLDLAGDVIIREARNFRMYNLRGDMWWHQGCWSEGYRKDLFWFEFLWYWSLNGFVGLLAHATEELYVLPKQWWPRMPGY